MIAELIRKPEKVRFIWGQFSDIPDGHVRVLHYNSNVSRGETNRDTYTIPHARKYWLALVQTGFHHDNSSCRTKANK